MDLFDNILGSSGIWSDNIYYRKWQIYFLDEKPTKRPLASKNAKEITGGLADNSEFRMNQNNACGMFL